MPTCCQLLLTRTSRTHQLREAIGTTTDIGFDVEFFGGCLLDTLEGITGRLDKRESLKQEKSDHSQRQ